MDDGYCNIYGHVIEADIRNSASDGDIMITHNGIIGSKGGKGIIAATVGTGDITIETGKKSRVTATQTTQPDINTANIDIINIHRKYATGIDVALYGTDRDGDVTITHHGRISAKHAGIAAALAITDLVRAQDGDPESPPGSFLTVYDRYENYIFGGKPAGRFAADSDSTGKIMITTAEGSEVISEESGITGLGPVRW